MEFKNNRTDFKNNRFFSRLFSLKIKVYINEHPVFRYRALKRIIFQQSKIRNLYIRDIKLLA